MSSEMKKEEKEKKVGVYICHCGGNISDHVDVKKLAENIQDLPGVTVSHTNMFMCSDPGQELIQEDIKNGTVNRVVVASCAPSLHELTFRSAIKRADMNPYLYEHANIREQVSWVHHGEQATEKATALVAAAIAKSQNLEPLDPIRVDAKNHATVIGGGIAGLRAALDLSRRGIEVALVEKSPYLGGQAAKLDTLVPTGEKAGDLIEQLANAVLKDTQIAVYTCSEVVQSKGYVGNFKVIVKQHPPSDKVTELEKQKAAMNNPHSMGYFIPFSGFYPKGEPIVSRDLDLDTGVIIFATGFKTYIPREGEYGYGSNTEVITLPQLIQWMSEEKTSGPVLKINGRNIRRVAFIHCVGSRQIPGIHEPDETGYLNEYCSRTCCSATLQAANEIREMHPKTHVFEYYRDIRTYGRGHEDYYDRASNNHVIFFRFEPDNQPLVERTEGSSYPLRIKVTDTLTLGEEITAEVDLVVLAVGMEPSGISDLVEMMKLPVGADHFLQEVHPKLRPVELANTGMLLAGTCQAPMDIGEACSAAQAASVKSAALLSKGYVELDPFVAEVNPDKCVGSAACVEACPIEGTITLIETEIEGERVKRAEVNPALCTGCGICVAVCKDNAIDVKGWSLKQYEKMVDAIVAA
jgi:heterodisulfide reductase subunit A